MLRASGLELPLKVVLGTLSLALRQSFSAFPTSKNSRCRHKVFLSERTVWDSVQIPRFNKPTALEPLTQKHHKHENPTTINPNGAVSSERQCQKHPAAWFFVGVFLVRLCFRYRFKQILKLFSVGKKSATFCVNPRKRVVSARFRVP